MKAHAPAAWTDEEALAVRALLRDESHRKAVDWIIRKACALYDMSYRDESEGGTQATAFHEGRRMVGNSIVKMGTDEVGEILARNAQLKEAKK